ncbi:hypothetical protein [Alcaligenes faecalis]|uniref:hypothetical protein n=1 Tax=Alcaligenes faecalis TaxID=511 RepID=UPI00068DFF81|nr:hypothetical protein [Alcaligenes faecalis]
MLNGDRAILTFIRHQIQFTGNRLGRNVIALRIGCPSHYTDFTVNQLALRNLNGKAAISINLGFQLNGLTFRIRHRHSDFSTRGDARCLTTNRAISIDLIDNDRAIFTFFRHQIQLTGNRLGRNVIALRVRGLSHYTDFTVNQFALRNLNGKATISINLGFQLNGLTFRIRHRHSDFSTRGDAACLASD